MKCLLKTGVSLLSLTFLLSSQLSADDIDDLISKAYSELSDGADHSMIRALDIFEEAAELGSNEAAHAAGLIYLEGKSAEPNLERAFDFFTEAANRGYAPSQNHLGSMYQRGFPNPALRFANYRRAANLYERAAEQNYGPAEYNLGNLYRIGRGGPKDMAQSLYWFGKAAQKNIPEAQFYIGMASLLGEGMPMEKEKAYELLCMSASNGFSKAREVLDINFGAVRPDCELKNRRYNDASELLLVVNTQNQEISPSIRQAASAERIQTNYTELIYSYAQLTVAADSGSIAAIREKSRLSPFLNDNQKHEALLLARKLLFSEQDIDDL